MFKLGIVVNPFAGLGGPMAMKGSDGLDLSRVHADDLGRSAARALRCLERIAESGVEELTVYGFAGLMSAQSAANDVPRIAGLPFISVGQPADPNLTTQVDTQEAAQAIVKAGVDLLLFVGGDGTARDIFSAVGTRIPCLGVPAGVKMHSGVYAVSPESAADIVVALITGKLVEVTQQEVRDIDEEAFRAGTVRSKYFGELTVPSIGGFLQHVKAGGREQKELVLADIGDHIIEEMDPESLYVVGPGSTTAAIMAQLGLDNTLLGVDLIANFELQASDVNAELLMQAITDHQGPVKAVITAIGGQGHILGRGNQQLTPAIIRLIGRDNFIIVATKTKITELNGRPLLVDSNDPNVDREWQGFIKVVTGYRDSVMYRVSASGE
ncbi:ATP-NAD kinase family protein [Zhongshania sp.]|jgi:predicted polyphosphate/ATP-dependent NAD kinase|uniref:ATP-NAD kinase family protein n=1 Tax=Zhongshania sp. TaxID=1971902 RepID=UPI001B480DA5|nr:ATP-NAD kinase family protein [Zhongshania sp.]MBQ0794385.1 ATP-NAD kinase family protein [Zhongshania sp.]